MMKTKQLVLLAAAGLIAIATQTQAIIINGTGMGGMGAAGTVDSNYTVGNDPGADCLIQYDAGASLGQLIGKWWAPNLPGGKWISPYVRGTDTDPWLSDRSPFWYDIQTTATAGGIVSGVWATDNRGYITVNAGAPMFQVPAPGLTYYTPFTLSLAAGDTVHFWVENWAQGGTYGNPAGLLVSVQVPDGGMTLALLGLALTGLAGLRRKLSA